MFDLASSQALGCRLHRVHGADEEDWAALLSGDRGGEAARSSLRARTAGRARAARAHVGERSNIRVAGHLPSRSVKQMS